MGRATRSASRTVVAMSIAIVVLGALIVAPAGAAPTTGAIAGATIEASTGTGLGGVCIEALQSVAANDGAATTASDGTYAITGLVPGNYSVVFDPTCGSSITSSYATKTPREDVTVASGATKANVTASFVQGGAVAGKIMDATTGAGLAGVCVYAQQTVGGLGSGWAKTAADGTYTVSALLAGLYAIQIDPTCVAPSPYAVRYLSAPVTIKAGVTKANVNASMVWGGSITGAITDVATGAGIAGACVSAMLAGGSFPSALVKTASDGTYTMANLYPGNYTLKLDPSCSGTSLKSYPDTTVATAVVVLPGTPTTNVNVALSSAPIPAPVVIQFVAASRALSTVAMSSILALAKKLVAGASVTSKGYAKGNAKLARSRAVTVARYLSFLVAIHVTLKTVTSASADRVVVAVTSQ